MRHVALNDIMSSVSKLEPNSQVASSTWSKLLTIFMEKLRLKQFDVTLEFLNCSSWIDFQVAKSNINASFYGTELQSIAAILVNELNSESNHNANLIFENINQLCRHREVRIADLYNVLLSSFSHFNPLAANVPQQVIAVAKSLSVTTKVKSLDTLCRFGNTEKRLPLIKTCISSNDVELAVASIR